MITLIFDDFLGFLTETNPAEGYSFKSLEALNFKKIDNLREQAQEISEALKAMEIRTTYYQQILPCTLFAYRTACSIFPAYKFLIPTVLNVDWLAMMDWKQYHRDHIIHQPLTAYIVSRLLFPKSPEDKKGFIDVDQIAEDLSNFKTMPYIATYLEKAGLSRNSLWLEGNELSKMMWKHFFVETALTAALFHDLGYPWQHQNKENCVVNKFANPILCNDITQKTKEVFFDYPFLAYVLNGYSNNSKCISNFHGSNLSLKCMFNCCAYSKQKNPDNRMERFCGRIKEMHESTHGLPGALNFLHLHDAYKIGNFQEHPINRLSLEWAAAAIAMHDMKHIYWGQEQTKKIENKSTPEVSNLRIHADKDPISAIVTLADELQEFERPTSSFKSTEKKINVKFDSACEKTVIIYEPEKKSLEITFFLKSKSAYWHKMKSISNDEAKLFNPDNGFINLKPWGISHVKMKVVKCEEMETDSE